MGCALSVEPAAVCGTRAACSNVAAQAGPSEDVRVVAEWLEVLDDLRPWEA